MRISILKQREEYREILVRTLQRFWRHQFGQSIEMRWLASTEASTNETWLCNDYLNCIFRPRTKGDIFGPIRAEYATSIHAWRTPIQRLYVYLATRSRLNSRFAHDRLEITPTPVGAGDLLIVPGNRKLRIINKSSGSNWVIRKDGFSRRRFKLEIDNRTKASGLGIPVPEILDNDTEHDYYCERFVLGTPANRLTSPAAADELLRSAFRDLEKLATESIQSTGVSEYCDSLVAQIGNLIGSLSCADDAEAERIRVLATNLAAGALEGLTRIPIVETHGDFQPGNVLQDESRFWVIDWEYGGRRFAWYDPFVMVLTSRFPDGLSGRLRDFVRVGPPPRWPKSWPFAIENEIKVRRQLACLFLLEELIVHITENAEPPIHTMGSGLKTLTTEADSFVKSLQGLA